MDEGQIEVDSIVPISMADITPDLARRSGFNGVVDLLKTAKHGKGENVYHVNQDLLVSRVPDRYFVPPSVGPHGWVGIYLDRRPAWTDVAERLRESYGLVAAARLIATVDADLAK